MTGLNLNHTTPQPIDISGPLDALLGQALIAKQKAEYDATRGRKDNTVAYKRIGAGYCGTPCLRELGYKFHKYPKDPLTGEEYPRDQLARHAEIGHWAEDHTVDVMRAAGFDVTTFETNQDGSPVIGYNGKPKQHGFMSAPNSCGQFQLAGELDGIIHSGPAELPASLPAETRDELEKILGEISYPCALEHKKATHKKFLNFQRDGVKKSEEKYYAQMQLGMAYCGMQNCLFVMLDVDQCVYYIELVKFNLEDAQRYNDRAVQVIQSEKPEDLPRIANKPDDFRCTIRAKKGEEPRPRCEYRMTQCFKEHFHPVHRRVDTDGTDTSLPWNGVPVWGAGGVDGSATQG